MIKKHVVEEMMLVLEDVISSTIFDPSPSRVSEKGKRGKKNEEEDHGMLVLL